MRTIKMRRGVLLGLAVAAGTLGAAATAPIAGADDTPVFTIVDDTPVPALTDLVTPTAGYDNQFTIGLGSTEETFITEWNGTGAPTTTEVTFTLPTGVEGFGFSDIDQANWTVGADTYFAQFTDSLFEFSSATSYTLDLVPPTLDISTSF
jgi:hypothetical protein